VVEALQIMHDDKFLTLPVGKSDGTVVGIVDVMDLMYGCGGAEGWRSIFDAAMVCADDESDDDSVHSGPRVSHSIRTSQTNKSRINSTMIKMHDEYQVSKLSGGNSVMARNKINETSSSMLQLKMPNKCTAKQKCMAFHILYMMLFFYSYLQKVIFDFCHQLGCFYTYQHLMQQFTNCCMHCSEPLQNLDYFCEEIPLLELLDF
jgi:hypothetical protein